MTPCGISIPCNKILWNFNSPNKTQGDAEKFSEQFFFQWICNSGLRRDQFCMQLERKCYCRERRDSGRWNGRDEVGEGRMQCRHCRFVVTCLAFCLRKNVTKQMRTIILVSHEHFFVLGGWRYDPFCKCKHSAKTDAILTGTRRMMMLGALLSSFCTGSLGVVMGMIQGYTGEWQRKKKSYMWVIAGFQWPSFRNDTEIYALSAAFF